MGFDPIVFGITIGGIIETYGAAVRAWASPFFHLGILVVIALLARYGSRARAAYVLYFLVNYAWLFIAIGIYASIQLYRQAGPVYFAMYAATPVLLAVIFVLLLSELRQPRTDWSLAQVPGWRWVVAAPMMAWAFFYPNWRFDGTGFDWNPAQLVTGNFGLMGCPVTLMALTLLFLRYPRVNPHLFRVMTMYGILLGGAMTAVGYKTDIPFLAMGVICLGLMLVTWASARFGMKAGAPEPGVSEPV